MFYQNNNSYETITKSSEKYQNIIPITCMGVVAETFLKGYSVIYLITVLLFSEIYFRTLKFSIFNRVYINNNYTRVVLVGLVLLAFILTPEILKNTKLDLAYNVLLSVGVDIVLFVIAVISIAFGNYDKRVS